MDRTIKFEMNVRLYERVMRQIWALHAPISGRVVLFALYQAPLVLGLIAGYRSSLFFGVAIATSLYGFWSPFLYLRTIWRAKKKWGHQKNVSYHFKDTFLEMADDVARVEVFWTSLGNVQKLKVAWVLQFQNDVSLILLTSALDEEVEQFIDSKLAENRATEIANAPPSQPKAFDY